MRQIDVYDCGEIKTAWQKLLNESASCKDTCYCIFNGKKIYSTDTLNDAYVKITGKTKVEFDKIVQEHREEYIRKEKEHRENIPNLIPEYCKKARGIILEEQYDYWDTIVPIRLGDIYHGMELDCTLSLCKIMRDESIDYDKRLRKAYDEFKNQGHSGMSASLVAAMLRNFCPDGEDLADAVMSFRFEKEEE